MNAPILAEHEILKRSETLCPFCLQRVPGTTFVQENAVYLTRTCPEHGVHTALIASDRAHYFLRDEVPHPPPSGNDCCGTGPVHRSCVALLEITEACNLSCSACYANSPSGQHVEFDVLLARLDRFLAERGRLDVLQISGGEPTIHPDFLRLLDAVKARDVDHVMINTNGLRLAEDPSLAREIAARRPRVELYLQLDGLDRESHVVLRGADLLEKKRAALAACAEVGLPVTLVCTVVENVNDTELGELMRLATELPIVRGVTFQPATFAGRYELGREPNERSTLADVAHALEAQTPAWMAAKDFVPLPCSDPNCCSFTFLHRGETGVVTPLSRVVSVEDHLDELADRIAFTADDTGGCCGTELAGEDLLRVVIKPFMDAHTYDQDRIDECCVHIIDEAGQGVSFCEYNTLVRPGRADSALLQIGK